MRKIIFSLLIGLSLVVHADIQAESDDDIPRAMQKKLADGQFDIPKIGHFHFVHLVPGEPVTAPERLGLVVKCLGAKTEKIVFKGSMCRWTAYDVEGTTLTIDIYSGHADPKTGAVVCDLFDSPHVDLSQVCAKTPASTKKTSSRSK